MGPSQEASKPEEHDLPLLEGNPSMTRMHQLFHPPLFRLLLELGKPVRLPHQGLLIMCQPQNDGVWFATPAVLGGNHTFLGTYGHAVS